MQSTSTSPTMASHGDTVRAYMNPVYGRSFPDPYVLKYCGEFWAYCTDFQADGGCFGVMRSRDLVHWEEIKGAMTPLPGNATCYWAPEVSYLNGRFYMYYSVGNEERMEIRVAIADHPSGPFIDSGRRLTGEDFAIDAHMFEDEDGSSYLFYATDFLEHTFIGTGTVCDRMLDPLTLAGSPRPVARARYDWQVYDPQRESKGGVRWHTVEGPFVLKHKGRYYEMFSGGNWQNVSYGVGYAVSNQVATDNEWEQITDGERILPILRTLPGEVIGPGHNSVVRGPDNRQLFCVYHRWDAEGSARILCIDRMEFVGERMIVLGPSTGPQPMPILPSVRGFTAGAVEHGGSWRFNGSYWNVQDRVAAQPSIEGETSAVLPLESSSFLAELHLSAGGHHKGGSFGVRLTGTDGPLFQLAFSTEERSASVGWESESGWREETVPLSAAFDPSNYHRIRLEVDHPEISLNIDGIAHRWQGWLAGVPSELALFTERSGGNFAGFELTYGYEDLFMEEGDPGAFGWEIRNEGEGWKIGEKELRRDRYALKSVIEKRVPFESYEAVINIRLEEGAATGGCYGFLPAIAANTDVPLLTVERGSGGWEMIVHRKTEERIPLPQGFDPSIHQQFRFRKEGGRLLIQWEGIMLGEIEVSPEPTHLGLYARGAAVGVDMVRCTAMRS